MTKRHGRAARAKARAGFGLIEILIAVSVFVVAFGALTTTLVSSTSLVQTNREQATALAAAQSIAAQLSTTEFSEVFARYNGTVADDLAGACPGLDFAVEGLDPRRGDADGMAGRLEFPGDGVLLREDVTDTGLGMPRDLDGDGAIDGADHAGDYRILPVRIVIEWRGQRGNQRLEFVTALSSL